jgi:GT2 family glycosyltransferase
VGAAIAQELADGLWVAGTGQALSLRYELLPVRTPRGQLRHGVRLLTDTGSGHLDLHFRPAAPMPVAGARVPVSIECWLAVATEAAVQAQAELWLTARRDAAFTPLRRIRRHRIFRRPSLLEGELLLTEEEAAEPGLWLTLSVADARGVCALQPVIGEIGPLSTARMEDSRLEGSFDALVEMVRLHGQADAKSHELLPPVPPPAGAALPCPTVAAEAGHPFTQVILPVYNGDTVVRECLRALRHAATGPCEVIVVDDGSRSYTAEMLHQEVAGDRLFRLHRRDINRGYTKSINEGVLLSTAPWVVVLNSDTIVSHGWLDRLHDAARARPGTGMAGPLSNAATWQSIPMAKRADGSWSTNDAIRPGDVERVQSLLSQVSERAYPEFHVLNGFATLIAREVFDTVGLYDEDAFPIGYGEETDLCLRARRAGFRLTVADDCFVYHHKSVTFGANRQHLTRAGGFEMTNKHLGVNTAALEAAMQSCAPMVRLRARMADLLAELD